MMNKELPPWQSMARSMASEVHRPGLEFGFKLLIAV